MPGLQRIGLIIVSESFRNPIFGQIFDQRAENGDRNTKINRGQETHPIRVNARYEMNLGNSFFQKVPETPFRPNIWPPGGRKWG